MAIDDANEQLMQHIAPPPAPPHPCPCPCPCLCTGPQLTRTFAVSNLNTGTNGGKCQPEPADVTVTHLDRAQEDLVDSEASAPVEDAGYISGSEADLESASTADEVVWSSPKKKQKASICGAVSAICQDLQSIKVSVTYLILAHQELDADHQTFIDVEQQSQSCCHQSHDQVCHTSLFFHHVDTQQTDLILFHAQEKPVQNNLVYIKSWASDVFMQAMRTPFNSRAGMARSLLTATSFTSPSAILANIPVYNSESDSEGNYNGFRKDEDKIVERIAVLASPSKAGVRLTSNVSHIKFHCVIY